MPLSSALAALTRGAALTAAVSLFALTAGGPARAADFPVDETFGGSTAANPNWVFTNTSLTGDGWLRLTDNGYLQAGTAVLNDAFPATSGIYVSFDYAVYGGHTYGDSTGDGFSFFLLDGSAAPSVGERGAGLGYSCVGETVTGGPCTVPGVQGGYVGIGMDTFGNNSHQVVGTDSKAAPGRTRDQVVLHGSGSGLSGFTYLTSAAAPGGTTNTGSRADYRTAVISVYPDAAGHKIINVSTNTGPGTPQQAVIHDFNLNAAPGQAPLPATFKLGFSGSTGYATDYHEIRNLKVLLPVDVAITKKAPATVHAGEPITYQLHATNKGPNPSPDSIVTDDVPAAITGVRWTCTGTGGTKCLTAAGAGNKVKVPVDLPVNGTATITVTGTATAAGSHANTSSVTAQGNIDSSKNKTVVTNTAVITPCEECGDLTPPDNNSTTKTDILPPRPVVPPRPTLPITGPDRSAGMAGLAGTGLIALGALLIRAGRGRGAAV